MGMAVEQVNGMGSDRSSGLRVYGAVFIGVLLALGVAKALQPLAGLENVDLVFLTAVITIAAHFGLGPSLVASVVSVLAYNYFFIPPLHTFHVADPKNLAALTFFLVFAIITSNLAARVRAQALVARLQARTTGDLYAFSRGISAIPDVDGLVTAAAERIASLLDRDIVLLLPDETGQLQVKATSVSGDMIEEIELDTARTAWRAGEWTGREVMRIGQRLFYSLRAGPGAVGVVGLSRNGMHESLSDEEEHMLGALCNQVAVALERIRLGNERDEARLAVESERLRTALLSSLSHDLKTPLASIMGAITALRQFPSLYDADAREELASTIQDETERMTSFVANLLDMTRLEAGGLSLDREPVDVGEVIGTALRRVAGAPIGQKVMVDLASDLPMLDLDPVLFEQVLVNLLDNAAKYAWPGSTVTITGRRSEGEVEISVIDEGPGLAREDLERVFDKFYRASRGDRQRAGTGLGLAISRGFVEALGGRIRAGNRLDGSGAMFTVTFPRKVFSAPWEEVAE
jgi:two-component system, OmpR family, sensor histidine kinase KdpD